MAHHPRYEIHRRSQSLLGGLEVESPDARPVLLAPASTPSAQLWTLPGGLRVAFERRAGPGFAFDLRVPVGNAHDPPGQEGAAGVLEEWLFKGAGGMDARALQDAFDDLGVRRGGGVGPEATRFTASGLGADLGAALRLTACVLIQPELPEAELNVLTDLARQDLEGLADSPSDLLAVHARRLAFPGRPAHRSPALPIRPAAPRRSAGPDFGRLACPPDALWAGGKRAGAGCGPGTF
ncbi:M16 family metallopeptidase [Deinococcus malanensis]|uniref:M16 family metallopeptidase n=1 Tax=Deinococcus malanensis TaxID=1706855 RepID=UPI003626F5D5